jgi:ABC-2 type transport system permease protein
MRALIKLAIVQTKLYLREPIGVFFTLAYGPLLLIMMGFIFGSEPQAILNGLSQLDISVPSYIAMIIGLGGLTAIPIGVTTRRENGVLRRFYATPLRPLTYFLADILAPFVVTLMGAVLLIAVGLLVYHVRFDGNWLSVTGGICFCMLSFFGLGYALSGIFPNTRVAVVVGNVLIIPMVMLSGAMVPLEVMPASVQNIANYVPLTHAVYLLRGLWFGESWGQHMVSVAVLGGVLLISMIVIGLTFKWE